jgi:3-phosphoshikimate 1-carboxyvinyltransferase
MISVSSAWTFEAICAAALAVRMPLTLSYPPQTVSHSLKLLTLLGYHSTMPDNMSVMDTEIARRLAKVSGLPPLKIQRLEWTHSVKQTIDIPGDTTLAAAIAGAGSIVQGSDVTLKDVLWEHGRRGFFEALHRMKGMIKYEQTYKKNSFDSAHITIGWSNLEGIHVTSDQALTFMTELLILGVVAASAHGETVISDGKEGLKHGRYGFSTLAKGLKMLGSYVGDFSDGIVINGGHKMRGDLVDSGGRADIALALAVTGMNAAGTTTVFGFDGNAYPVREFIQIVKKFTSQTVLPDQ